MKEGKTLLSFYTGACRRNMISQDGRAGQMLIGECISRLVNSAIMQTNLW